MNTNDLKSLSDQELSRLFALEVAGLVPHDIMMGPMRVRIGWGVPDGETKWEEPPFAFSVDAVLPYLEKHTADSDGCGEPEVFRIYSPAGPHDVWTIETRWLHHDGTIGMGDTKAKTLPRAICETLILAKRASEK